MAEDQEGTENLTTDEADELERLLEDTGTAETSAGGLKGLLAKFKSVLSNKKLLMIFGGGVLVLILAIGAGIYFFMGEKEVEEAPVEEQGQEEIIDEADQVKIEKVNIYKLDPFFLPIRYKGKETGEFISITANLLLSNSVLDKEIDKILPLMRKNIYNILRRKRPGDFTKRRSWLEERIKKEILTASNSLLLSGTGTITNVYFASFMIK